MASDAEYWEDVAEEWGRKSLPKFWRAHHDAVNRQLLARWLPAKVGRVLKTDMFDEAYTEGLYPLLKSRAGRVVGMDLSLPIIKLAKARSKDLRAASAYVGALPFSDGVFDVVLSNSTLDHFDSVKEIRRGLGELTRVLRPGGQLIVTLDNPVNPVIALRNALPFTFLNRMGILPYYVGATYGPRSLTRELRRLNLNVTEIASVYHFPRLAAVAILGLLGRYATPGFQNKAIGLMMKLEKLAKLPTRFVTGYFVAAHAVKQP